MGKGGNLVTLNRQENNDQNDQLPVYSWEEIKGNKNWIVIDGLVYDFSKFSAKHPGGPVILKNQGGTDATDAFRAFHTNFSKVNKYLHTLKVGRVSPGTIDNPNEENREEIIHDFRNLRQLAEKMNLFKPNYFFYAAYFMHLILLDLVGWLLIYYSGYQNWFTYFIAAVLLATTQIQGGWLQHDFGHLSVFKSNKLNHFVQRTIICFLKGVSADWWNYRHFIHHAKPNAIHKDHDMRFYPLAVVGKVMPREVAEKKKGIMPYNLQHAYFFMIVPPLLLPLYFNFENIYYLTKRKKLRESTWVLSFFLRWFLMFAPILGIMGTIKLYLVVRFIESHWFVWVTQMNHLPMHVDHDRDLSWFRMQLITTCNVEHSLFNDWFSGHLNYQIEHHLFPTMPRHNYHKIVPFVKSMCEKHKIEYNCKTLSKAMGDIYWSLKESGELWYSAYNM